MVHKTNALQEVNRQPDQKAGDKKIPSVLLLLLPRHDPGALQRRSGKNRDLLGGVQALARLHQPQREGALCLFHRARPEEATMPDGSEETAICLHCKVPQVWGEVRDLPNNVELSVSLSAQRKATTMKAEGFINKHNKPIAIRI